MTSIDDRIVRLQHKMMKQAQTPKQKKLKEILDSFLKLQDGKCAICKVVWRTRDHTKPVIDYFDKSNSNIRGLLCEACDVMITNSGNSLETLQAAVEYVRKGGIVRIDTETFNSNEDDWRKKK